MNNLIYICAGGTGGHINAALSLGEYFSERGWETKFYTGTRYLDFQLFQAHKEKVVHLDSRPLRGKNPLILTKNILLNMFVFLTVVMKYASHRPRAVIGCGGYVCGPTLLAAKILGVKTYIIEQNAVAGLTNKLLAKFSTKVFLNFQETKGIAPSPKNIVSGNPVRSKIQYVSAEKTGPVRILAFGGSLGAKQVNEAISDLASRDWDQKISIVHQVGKNNLKQVRPGKNVIYEQKEYLDNMDELYRWSNIIIARAGASTISELRVARRPSVLIPFPFATDNHQKHNAEQLAKEKAFYVKVVDQDLSQREITDEVFESINEIIDKSLFDPYKDSATKNSCEIIFKEVACDVRN